LPHKYGTPKGAGWVGAGVVLLLHVCLVVFEKGARAGLFDAGISEPFVKVVVQKLAAVIAHVPAAMRDGIHLGPARFPGVPALGADFGEGFGRVGGLGRADPLQ